METFLNIFLLFLQISFYPIAVFVICGLIIGFCRYLVLKLCGHSGRGIIYVTSIVGTPVHELGHATMCLLFGHSITDMRLWCPLRGEGTLGFVEHTYNKKNPYKLLGNMFIGMGPIFSGLLFTFLVMFLCFPDAFDFHIGSVFTGGSNITTFFEIFTSGFDMLRDMFSDSTHNGYIKALGIILIISTCLHISLSVEDIKGSLSSLPLYFVITLLFTVITYFVGGQFEYSVISGLEAWISIGVALYLPVIVASIVILIFAFIFYIIRSILHKV